MPLTLNPNANPANLKAVDFDPFAGPKLLKAVPTTPSQVELWLSCIIGGDDANRSYNESVSLDLEGQLNQCALIKALEQLMRRHEILRSTFSSDGKTLCIHEAFPLELELIDISDLASSEQQTYVNKVHQTDADKAFDLLNGPLFRSYLIKLSEEQHMLKLSAHHIVCDGWSFGILLENISKIYNSIVNNEPLILDDVIPYSRYARELDRYLNSEQYKTAEKFWLSQFADEVPVLDIPTDRRRPNTRTFKSKREDFIVPKELIENVKKTGATAGASLVSTLIAAFEAYLHLTTQQNTIVLGIPAAGQNATGHYELVGHCVNLLPLRSEPKGEQSFSDYLSQRKSQILDAYDHQQFTFGTLMQKLNIPRDSSRIPLVPIVFNIDMGMDASVSFSGLTHSLANNPRNFENFEIFLNLTGTEQALTFEWSYNEELFRQSTIQRMMEEFIFFLEEIVAHPKIKIKHIALNSNTSNKQIEICNNSTKIDYPNNTIVTEFISKKAQQHFSKTAMFFQNSELSYQELELKSNQLANLLIEQGVNQGAIVGLMLNRSIEMIVSLLAIIKSGAAYLPLDPHYPESRLSYMLEDSKASHLILSKSNVTLPNDCTAITIERALLSLNEYSSSKPKLNRSGSDLAYVLYTSGSTGKPKGVQVEHHSLTNFLLSVATKPGMSSTDRILAISTISFDISVTEILLPLITGASIYLVDSYTARDGRELLNLINEKRITIMQATPTTWRMMIAAGWETKLPLKIICTGEAFPRDLAKELISRGSEVWNGYGPTETTIWSTLKKLDNNSEQITIGKPLNNTKIFILDNRLKPVDVGTTGEICIAGQGLARGYLNLIELTLEKFVTCTISGHKERIYRTGDLGYYLENGDIVCLGRCDEQVKIRGQRIELSEIEFALSQQHDIKEAVVTVQKQGENQQLIAHIVPSAGQIQEWHHLWDEIYTQGIEKEKELSLEDQDLDIAIVTNDEVDGVIHGAEWKSESLKRLKALKPDSILELGSGGGHIMFGLAPSASKYVATDYSEVAINKLKEKLSLNLDKWGHVEAFPAAADDFSKIHSTFDLVLLHSVIQYFPDLRYLFDVINKSVEALNDGGCIFIGDSQTKDSSYMHLASEQLKYVSEKATISDFKNIINYRIQQQNELSIDPDFFYFLPTLIPSITAVDIQIRSGEHLNETTKSHYDVWLYKGNSAPRTLKSEIIFEWIDVNSIERLENILKRNRERVVQINNINNKRIDHDYTIVKGINELLDHASIDELRSYIDQNQRNSSVNPTDLWDIGQTYGFNTHVRWADNGGDGQVEVVFLPIDKGHYIPGAPSKLVIKNKEEYLSAKLDGVEYIDLTQSQIDRWKAALKLELPEHMIPSTFVGLTQLPTTKNGKIDRKNLPTPTETKAQEINIGFIAPNTEIEIAIAEIWKEFLGIESISTNSNFFESGGHSLTAVRVMLAIEKRFGIKLPISILFENSTIEKLANLISGEPKQQKWESLVPIKRTGSKAPIYLVHGFGLNVLTFEPFLKYMDEQQPIYALQGLGLLDSSRAVSSIKEIAEFYISEILENDPIGPYSIAGYSAGGVIAYEMARKLKELGKQVSTLAILDTYVGDESPTKLTFIQKTLRQFRKMIFVTKNFYNHPIKVLDYQLEYLKSKVDRRKNLLGYKVEVEPVTAVDHYELAYSTYTMVPLDISVDLFQARERIYFLSKEEYYGWEEFATEGVNIHEVSGDHLTCLTYPYVEELAMKLQNVLDLNSGN